MPGFCKTIRFSAPALLLVAAFSFPCLAQKAKEPSSAVGNPLLDIVLEKQTSSGIQQMRQEHVFEPGDIIRFRLASRYNGYMYVMDQGTSGKFSTIFPSPDAGNDNRLTSGSSYLVPSSGDGWFQIEGPAGFEVLYFLLSPTPIAPLVSQQKFVAPGPISSLKPRCNDAIFKARGECMDSSAGPSVLPSNATVPAPLQPLAGSASRDIIFTRKGEETTVASSSGSTAPVIYTFRLAHH